MSTIPREAAKAGAKAGLQMFPSGRLLLFVTKDIVGRVSMFFLAHLTWLSTSLPNVWSVSLALTVGIVVGASMYGLGWWTKRWQRADFLYLGIATRVVAWLTVFTMAAGWLLTIPNLGGAVIAIATVVLIPIVGPWLRPRLQLIPVPAWQHRRLVWVRLGDVEVDSPLPSPRKATRR